MQYVLVNSTAANLLEVCNTCSLLCAFFYPMSRVWEEQYTTREKVHKPILPSVQPPVLKDSTWVVQVYLSLGPGTAQRPWVAGTSLPWDPHQGPMGCVAAQPGTSCPRLGPAVGVLISAPVYWMLLGPAPQRAYELWYKALLTGWHIKENIKQNTVGFGHLKSHTNSIIIDKRK